MNKEMSLITLYDTACGTLNVGDEIIQAAVREHLDEMFPESQFQTFSTHSALSTRSLKKAWKNELGFVAGTNLLRNHCRFRRRKNQWSIGFFDSFIMTPAILMGVGWNAYAEAPTPRAKMFYKKALHPQIIHSVRDEYTKDKLIQCGVTNVLNTGCPTLWKLSEEKVADIPVQKASNVVFTLTDYRIDKEADVSLVETLLKNYETVYFWPQGSKDRGYYNELLNANPSWSRINIIPPHLSAFNRILDEGNIDHVGTRLHAGIRALQRGRRSIIIGVDNRALEMKKDFGIPVLERADISQLEARVKNTLELDIKLPLREIEEWKSQFVNKSS